MIIWYLVPEICGVANVYNCYFSFWVIFCPFTKKYSPKNQNFKKWEKHLEISSLYTCVPKIMIRLCAVPKERFATDRRTDGRTKKWQIKVGAPPKKSRLRYIYNMSIKTWSHEHIQTWSSLYERVKIRKTAIKPAWLLITLVIELKQVRI